LQYIHEAVQSCLDNTYRNFEIIIVDDGSYTPLKIENLRVDPHGHAITILRNSENRGSGCARNKGIQHAKGGLIAFLDADDLWFPEILEQQVKIFMTDPSAVWVYTNGYYLINGKIMRHPNSYYHGFRKGFPQGFDVNRYHLQGYNYMTFSSNMFKRDVLLEVGLFNEALRVSEDWDLFVRVAERYPVHAINEPLMYYRVNNAGRHFINRDDYVHVNTQILNAMYQRQNLLPDRIQDLNTAIAIVYERAGIQRMNAGLNQEARRFLFHPRTKPLTLKWRMSCLRALSFLPNIFYKTALWAFDHL
jgi:glycosyltransferase involved in cell wall biosynthesis